MINRPGNRDYPQSRGHHEAPKRSGNIYWILALIPLLIIFATYYFPAGSNTREITSTKFKSELVSKAYVDSVVIINQKSFEIWLSESALEQPQYAAQFPPNTPATRGPHFTFDGGKGTETIRQFVQENNIPLTSVDKPDYFRTILQFLLPILILLALWGVFKLLFARR